MEIIVGTNNQGKLKEMQSGLKDPAIQLVSYRKYTTSQEQPAETGTTYAENAYLKARFFQQLIGRPVLGDDGGLTLTAFPDLLGIHTSRFFHSANPEEQNRELLHLFDAMIQPKLFVYDAIYNPRETQLLKEARLRGAETSNGLDMLLYQGAVAFEQWTGQKMPVSVVKRKIENR